MIEVHFGHVVDGNFNLTHTYTEISLSNGAFAKEGLDWQTEPLNSNQSSAPMLWYRLVDVVIVKILLA